MAKRFGKRGLYRNAGTMGGQLWGVLLSVWSCPLGSRAPANSRFKGWQTRQGWGEKRECPYFLPLVSPASKSVLCSATKCVRACVHRGREAGTTKSKNTR